MRNNRWTGLLLGGVALVALAACNETDVEAAQVSAAKTPREVCTERVVTTQKPVKDEHRVLGTVAGALVGGVVGNEIGGKGTGGDIATVAGAAAGGYAGNRVQKNVQKGATEQHVERTCRTVYE